MNKLVIFDCDGVLVDSEWLANSLEVKHLSEIGYNITAEESIKRFTGLSIKTVREKIFEEAHIEIPEDFFSLKLPSVLQAFEKELEPLIQPVLSHLQQNKIARCVASSSSKDKVIKCLEITKQKQFFTEDTIFTSQLVKRGKPFPDLFLHAAKTMGFTPENCVVIEDSFAGIEAALAANMQVIGFLGGSHAQYDWYKEKIYSFGIPVATTSEELSQLLDAQLQSCVIT